MLDLKEIVRRLKLSNKKAVAEAAGIHPNIVYRLANGDTESPSYSTIKKLSDVLKDQ